MGTLNGEIINNPGNWYNYNKMTGDLLMTQDFKNVLTVDKERVQFFILFDSLQTNHTFVHIPALMFDGFCKAIFIGDQFDIFEDITTKFVKSDYHTNGLISTGNPYDEYINESKYYLFNIAGNTYETFILKRKSLRAVFQNNPQADIFLSKHNKKIDDSYMKALADFLSSNNTVK